jgi:ribosomal protein L29
MKTREIKELQNRNLAELEKSVRDAHEKLRNLQLDLAAGKVKNIAELRILRKDIARFLTVLTAKRKEAKAAK